MSRFSALGLLLAIGACAADNKPPGQCTVTGSVLNSVTGERLKKADITLRSAASPESVYTALTDEAGTFSLVARDNDVYELVIRKRGFVQTGSSVALPAGQTTSDHLIRLTPQGVIAGRVLNRDGDPIPGVTVQAIRSSSTTGVRRYSVTGSAATNDLGEYRIFGLTPGVYYVAATYRGDSGSAAVYYPATPEVSRAARVDVQPGGELLGLNLAIGETHSLKIHGTLRGTAAVALPGVMIVAAPCDDGPLNRATTTVRKPDGRFELLNLMPGCYLLAADSYSGGKRYSARLPIHVSEEDIENVELNLVPPVQVTGVVRAEGDDLLPISRVAVNLESRHSKVTASGAPAEDGSLILNNIVPESYQFSVVVPDGYYLKFAKFGELDVLRYGLDLSRGATGRLEVVLSGNGGSIEGVVADENAQAIEFARVVLIAADETNDLSQIKIVVTDRKGRFRMRGIRPGDYKMYASQNFDLTALRDPVNAKLLEPHAQPVSIHEHSQESVYLKPLVIEALFAK
jgi:hypothetical protein